MSNTIDRRIVEMQFDNKDFERNVNSSVKSLDKLKESLNLEESAKGLESLEKAGHKFNLDGMVQAAEAVTSKFSILGTIGDQVLRRIGDAAFNAMNKMKNFVESLTIQPISTGFAEYETQINAIQTILSNTRDAMTKQGYSEAERLDIVNDRLDQLNHYADKTIYNFTEMTRNIGTFTAAGVELDTAVQSIQGIANLAAVSGSTSAQASRAMYQLSQAISTGTVRLLDWNSVVNAGMGGEVFQKALVRTATAMGKTVDVTVTQVGKGGKKVKKTVKRTVKELIEEEGSFRDSLDKKWLTSDILTATLEQFSWDFEQMAKDMGYNAAHMEEGILKAMEMKKGELLAQGYTLDEVEEIIQLARDATDAATKVKTFTQLFDTLKEAAQSGWTQTWEYIIGDFEQAKEMLTGISDFFGKIIGDSADARNKIFNEWNELGGRDTLWNNDPEKGPLGAFWNLAYGIKNIIDIIREEFQKIFPPATGKDILSFTQRIQQATAKFREWTEDTVKMEKIRKIIGGIGTAFGVIKSAVGYVINSFKGLLKIFEPIKKSFFGVIADEVSDYGKKTIGTVKRATKLLAFMTRIKEALKSVFDFVMRIVNKIAELGVELFNKIKNSEVLNKLTNGINDFVGKIPGAIDKVKQWVKGIIEYVKASGMLQKIWDNVKKFFGPVISGIGEFGKRLKEGLSNFFSKDVSGEEGMWNKLKARLSAFGSSFSGWFGTVKETVTNVWNNIKTFLTNFFTKTIPDFFNSSKVATSGLIAKIKSIDWVSVIKTAAGIYTGFKILSALGSIKSIGKGLKRLGGGLKSMGKGIKDVVKNGITITKQDKKDSLGSTLLKIAAAIGVVVASIYVLSKMETGDVVKGLGIISIIAIELLAISLLFKKIEADGKSFLMIAAGLALLVIPMKLLGSMDTKQALKGIIAIGIIMAEIGGLMRLAGKGFTGKTGFLGLAIAINLMVLAVKSLAKLDTMQALKGIITIGIIMAEIGGLMRSAGTGFTGKTGFLGLAIAINLMVLAVKSLAKLDAASMIKSLIGMEVLFLEMSSFMKKTSSLGKVSGLIGMAVAINLLAFAVKRMGKMDGKTITKGVLGLGGIILAFGAMAKITKGVKLGSSIVTLLTMAGTLILFVEMFKQVQNMNMDDMLKFAVSISATILALSVSMAILSAIPITGLLKGLANFAILVAGVGAIAIGLGALQNAWPAMTDFLESGGDVIGQIGSIIGKFIGGIGAGFGRAMKTYSETVSSIEGNFDESKNEALIAAAEGIGTFASSGKIPTQDTIQKLLGLPTDFGNFSRDIPAFGDAMSSYLTTVSSIADGSFDDSKNKALIAAAEGIAEFASSGKIPTQDTIQKLFGLPTDFGNFSRDIPAFGEAMSSYLTTVSSIADGNFKESKNEALIAAAEGIAEFASSGKIPTQDTIEKFFGLPTDFGNFSRDIPAFGTAMSSYLTTVSSIADGNFNNSKNKALIAAAEGIAEFASSKKIPTQGIIEKLFDLPTNFGTFSEDIVSFSDGLSAYATAVSGFSTIVSEDDMTASITALTKIQEFATALDPSGSFWDKLNTLFGSGSQSNTLLTLSGNMKKVGEDLKSFATNITGLDFSNTESVTQVMTDMQTFIETLNPEDGFFKNIGDFLLGSGSGDIVAFSGKMATFGNNFNTFALGIAGAAQAQTDFRIVDAIVQSFNAISSSIKDNGLKTSDIENAGKVLGSKFGSSVATAILDCAAETKNSVKGLSSQGASAAEGTYNTWESAGRYLGSGLSNGISAMAQRIKDAAVSAASGATRAIQITWSVHSPSRVGRDLGMNFDLGIAGGLEAYSKVISDRARDVGKSAVDSASTMLRGADGSIFDNLDPNPTIRPVIDLTNVQNGVSAINGMFNPNNMQSIGLFRGMNLSRGIDHLNLDGGRINGMFTDKHIVNNLEGLKTKIEELGSAVTNMKLVLDTGVLVGETSSQMDNQLGTLAMRRGRGN